MDLPSDVSSEQQVLGALVLEPDLWAEVSGIVEASDFYKARHRVMFELLAELHTEGVPIDPMIVAQRLPFRDVEPMFVPNLLDETLATTGAVYHAKRVRDAARLRRLALIGRDLGEAACLPGAELETVLDAVERDVFQVSAGVVPGISWDVALGATLDRVEHHYQTGSTMDGLETGLDAIDAQLGGVQPGWLIYVGARPGVGKTALALQLAINVAQRDHRVLVCSLEMSVEELARRACCRLSEVSYSRVRHNQMTERDWARFVQAKISLDGLPVDVFDNEVDTVPAVASRVRRLKPELVIIDYVQLMHHDRAKNRNEEVGVISRGLKLLARETGIPIIAPAQLNRAAEGRESKRPTLTDLRESGSLEQDADVVIFLSREDGGTTTHLDVAKFRHGPTGSATVGWDPQVTKFYDLY